jgi:hypothetical protein
VVQVSDDADFARGVTTIFNNDRDGSLGLGKGSDWEYRETHLGRVIDAKGVKGRYVRLWSNGSTLLDANLYTEVEVWGFAAETKPIPIEFPEKAHQIHGSPPAGLKIDPRWKPGKGDPVVWGSKDVRNLARDKAVTASAEPREGKLAMVTDGKKAGEAANLLTLPAGKQWVQVDLGERCTIEAVALWHRHDFPTAYLGVIVQASDDPAFEKGVKLLFNNDHKGKLGFGEGIDYHYFESHFGKVIDAKGVQARYVRLWSNGHSGDDDNHYTEVEVWGAPVK